MAWLVALPAPLVLARDPAWAREAPQLPSQFPPVLGIRVEVSASDIRSFQAGRPGVPECHQKAGMRVTCLPRVWYASAEATPLTDMKAHRQIGPELLFVRSAATRPQLDTGAGVGFLPLAEPVVVAEGSPTTYATPLGSRLIARPEPGVWDATGEEPKGLPKISHRRAVTNVRVQDGQSIGIGGPASELTQRTSHKVPILGDLPLVAEFFRHASSPQTKTQVVIIVTPHILGEDGSYPGQETGQAVAPRRQTRAGRQRSASDEKGDSDATHRAGSRLCP